MKNQWMIRCLKLAKNGQGNVSPNPLVGCLIIHKNQIIGEGYHQQIGKNHAEVNAINSVTNQELLKEAQLYVNLEPCAHYGLTPPCANLIIEKGVKKVIIANTDPFEKVSGKGIELLRAAGIEVEIGVEMEAGRWLNRRFFTFHEQKRPFVILKFAKSKNGFMDVDRKDGEKGINWITAQKTKKLTHLWRSEEDAILIGTNTATIDNPSLTTRAVSGKNPKRLVIDKDLTIKKENAVFSKDATTIVFNSKLSFTEQNIEHVQLDFEKQILVQILNWCYENKIQSVIVEGGAFTLNQFIDLGLWDEARVLTGAIVLQKGLNAPKIDGNLIESYYYGSDLVNIYTPIK